ncbi:hypothetical protein EW145_g3416 [Phellinidium pouzarii]|uniref:Maf/Ham1 n=1 Tax=Phellinidium pouzarii TaxID=167371 RepID=A0A4S4L759_9AGAM|nr:hypothetical protein EW145_g3416 [Phellinidium pouzarii]
MAPKHQSVKPNALKVPGLVKLSGKRVVLASASPRRKEILKTFGFEPEIVPSTFDETLPQGSFEDVHEYPVATASHKAVEVWDQLLLKAEDPDDPPDLVIGADTVVLTHVEPSHSGIDYSLLPQERPEILEKPISKADNLRMLLDLNGGLISDGCCTVYPILTAPGYQIKSIDERSLVYFTDNPTYLLEAYADSGEGVDRAGGFAVQGLGGMLIRKIDGDYNNVVGFPAASFFKFLDLLVDEEEDFLEI